MRTITLLTLTLSALQISACKEKAEGDEHSHDDLLRTIAEQQDLFLNDKIRIAKQFWESPVVNPVLPQKRRHCFFNLRVL